MRYQALVPYILCVITTGCSLDATLLTSSSTQLSIQKLDNSGVVTDTNQNSFLVQGFCKDISEVIISTDSFSIHTPCVNNSWSISLDLSAIGTQTIQVKLVGIDTQGNNSNTTNFNLVKKMHCSFNGQTMNDGQSVVAYTSANVSSGSCADVSETRLCNNGNLSGSALYSSCSVDAETSTTVSVDEFEQRVSEANGIYHFTLRLASAKPYPVNVKYFISGDYVYMLDADLSSAGVVSFAANETVKTLNFQVLNNAVPQPERLIQLNLQSTNQAAVTLGKHYQSRFFIKDDDGGYAPALSKAFVVGSQITCAIKTDGTLLCGGAQFGGSPIEVDAGTKYSSIEDSQQGNGDNQSFCGLTLNHKIKCNDGTNTTMTDVDSAANYLDFDSEYGLCGISDLNELKCQPTYGSNAFQVIDPGVSFKKVARSYNQVCGLTVGNSIRCANINFSSFGPTSDADPGVNYIDLSTDGQGLVYGLTTSGDWKVLCSYGGSCTPTILNPGTTYVSLFRQCAIQTGGQAQCNNSTVPLPANFQQINTTGSGGNYQRACGITTSGDLLCWNTSDYNYGGWRGLDVIANQNIPEISGLANVRNVALQTLNGSCAVLTNGKVNCFWGTSQGFYRSTPVENTNFNTFNVKEIYTNYFLDSDGYLYGQDLNSESLVYLKIDTVTQYSRFLKISSGNYNVCAFTLDNKINCQKSNGTFEYLNSGDTIKDFGNGGLDSQGCLINASGRIICWDHYYNTLPAPTIIDSTDTYAQISGDYLRGCAISSSQQLKCWDNNSNYSGAPVVMTVQDLGAAYASVIPPQGGYWGNTICGITTSGIFKCGIRNGTYADMDPGMTYALAASASCGVTTSGKYRCQGTHETGSVYTSWNIPITLNKWFSKVAP